LGNTDSSKKKDARNGKNGGSFNLDNVLRHKKYHRKIYLLAGCCVFECNVFWIQKWEEGCLMHAKKIFWHYN